MGNLSVVPAVPGAGGTGLPSSVASLGLEKTINVDAVFTGTVILEISNGKGYVPIATFTVAGRQTLKFAAQDVRVVRSASASGSPVVTVSSNDDGGQFAELATGSPGASSDLKALGTSNTIIVDNGDGELTMVGVALDTQTVTIGNKVYTFQTVLTNVDGNVLIGANQAESIINLVAAITLTLLPGFNYAAAMTVNTDVQANVGSTTSIMEAKALDSAGSAQGIATTETLTNGSWGATTLGKLLDGVVQVQTSEDDAVWTDLCSFSAPGHKTLDIIARFVRVNHVNNALGSTPTVSVGAINDDTAHKPLLVLVSTSNSVPWNAALGTSAQLTLVEDGAFVNPTNCEPGMILNLILVQDGAGAHVATWGSAWQWAGGTDPVITVAADAVDSLRGIVMTVDADGNATRILTEFAQAFAD